ncbi:uncharacterized protein LOC135838456 [Planococcus citri]|uniref:uncharacterized protein LOC135838456 n=1 Tax=Planococcus citri TaxID=170843 RepID=UPI0031F72299
MNNTTGVFYYSSCALILITFVSYFAVSYSSPAVLDGSKNVLSNNTDGSCVKLRSAPDKSITYKCNGEYSEYCTFGRIVPEHTVVKISCNPGYFLLNGDGNETTSVCIENKWIPTHVRCHKMCDRLYSNQLNVHLECFQGNKSIPCVDNSLISGARVRSSCKYAHRYENYKNTYQEINCGEDGKWDAALIPCISGCEKTPESHFEAPWHVTILYDFEKLLGCFGTIISPRLILTVESCLFSIDFQGGNANAADYSVIVARYPMYHRLYKVAEFQYFNRTKFSFSINRSLKPMIVVLKEELDFNSFVSPAHIQWENAKRLDMWNGTVKVPTLRRLESGMFSSHLINILATKPITNSVNFSSHIACKERWAYPYFAIYWIHKLRNDTEIIGIGDTFLYDKNFMCLEFENDSRHKIGSGVVVEENNCNFIRGIIGFDFDLSTYISALNDTIVFSKDLQALANKCSDEPLPPNLSTKSEETLKFYCNMISGMAKTINTIGNELEKQPKIAGFIDIADYVGWIKKVRDEIENQ